MGSYGGCTPVCISNVWEYSRLNAMLGWSISSGCVALDMDNGSARTIQMESYEKFHPPLRCNVIGETRMQVLCFPMHLLLLHKPRQERACLKSLSTISVKYIPLTKIAEIVTSITL